MRETNKQTYYQLIALDKISQFFKLNGYFYNNSFVVFFRISIGFLLLIHFLSYWSDFELLYGKDSIVPTELLNAYETIPIVTVNDLVSILNLFFSNNTSILLLKYVFIFLCILIIIGWKSRLFAILLLFLQISIVKTGILYTYGVDYFESISLLYIVIFPSESILPRNKAQERKDYTIYKRMIQYHLSISYFFSGFDKIIGFNWWNGEAIWKASNLPNFTKYIELKNITELPVFYITLGWFTILIELFYPLFINLNHTRKIWLILTIGMHLGIILLFNLYFFAAIMIIWNLTAYYFNNYNHEKY